MSTNDPSEGMLQYPSILVFTEENWDIPQYFITKGIPDGEAH